MIAAYDENGALIASADTERELWRMPGVSLRAMVVCPFGEEPLEIREAIASRERAEVVAAISRDTKTEIDRKVPELDERELGALLLEAARAGNEDVWFAAKKRFSSVEPRTDPVDGDLTRSLFSFVSGVEPGTIPDPGQEELSTPQSISVEQRKPEIDVLRSLPTASPPAFMDTIGPMIAITTIHISLLVLLRLWLLG